MKRKLLKHIYNLTIEKLPKHPLYGTKSFLHFSYVIVDGDIVEYGYNNHAQPEKHWGYEALNRGFGNYKASTHAELSAFKRARGLLRGAPFDMVNVRLLANLRLANSAPCRVCRSWLGAVGCRKIVFSIDGGWGEVFA